MVSSFLTRFVGESYRLGRSEIEVMSRFLGRAGFGIEVRLFPGGHLVAAGFPIEAASVWITPRGEGRAWPFVGQRAFHHRNPEGDLCMWFPGDRPGLRWTPDKSLLDLVLIVRRHLIFEEFYRRHQYWPVEDIAHGTPRSAEVPIETSALRRRLRSHR